MIFTQMIPKFHLIFILALTLILLNPFLLTLAFFANPYPLSNSPSHNSIKYDDFSPNSVSKSIKNDELFTFSPNSNLASNSMKNEDFTNPSLFSQTPAYFPPNTIENDDSSIFSPNSNPLSNPINNDDFQNPSLFSKTLAYFSPNDDFSTFLHQDYSPPSPPPPPPPPPSVSCSGDLGGVGDLNTTCQIVSDLSLNRSIYVSGTGNFIILPRRNVTCLIEGCGFIVNITGNFTLSENSTIVVGYFDLVAFNGTFGDGSKVNVTGLGGKVPDSSSGTPRGVDGSGGGHGGRGAACVMNEGDIPGDVWGGDTYAWSNLQKPVSFGSKGGTTSEKEDFGGGGGGRIKVDVKTGLETNGSFLADGGDGGARGGGGSGGSVFLKAYKMTGNGVISARGGNGFGGGGGGRISVDVFSRHDNPQILVHGGSSMGCPLNSGAAGTFYDAVPRSLTVNNYNLSSDTDTLLLEFPYQPLMTNIYIKNQARAMFPLLYSRVQVQGQISLLCGGVLSFGLAHYALSEFELLAEELLMSESVIKVYGALRMSVKMFLMWNSTMLVDGGGDSSLETSLLDASNLVVLRESSVIRSTANLGVHGQGLLNLTGPGDRIEAQRLVLSLFYSVHIGPGSVLQSPLENATADALTPKLNCEGQSCPVELLRPPEDCNVNSSLSFTLQICRVEDILIEGLVKGSVVQFHRARTITVQSSGTISASGMGCTGGVGRAAVLSNGLGGGAGHGGKGGLGYYNGTYIEGGDAYGDSGLPCELGSGSGNESLSGTTAGGGIIVMGSRRHPLSTLYVEGSVASDGGSFEGSNGKRTNISSAGPGGGSGGTILAFLNLLDVRASGTVSTAGGSGSHNAGGGGGGRIHFHWSDIPTGDVYQDIAIVKGDIYSRGGLGKGQGGSGENGTLSGRACPKGLYGTFCKECPAGTYKNVTGSERALCRQCPVSELPHRAVYSVKRGGVSETPCPYECVSERYHPPHCYTALEELVYTFGGPWLFGFLLVGLLILLALVLSVARMKFVSGDELPGPTPAHGSHIDHSFPFLESLNEVLETNRNEESQSHVHRIYFMGPNTFGEPWNLPHTPPEQVKEIVYEGEYNKFVDEMNAIAAYQWWEGSLHGILCILAYPLAWSWLQWRRRVKLQRLREFVRSEYDHACLRSCRSRALYEGLKVASTSDLMLAYVDVFLGGDEKRTDLPTRLQQRFPISLLFGGDGSYMAPFSLNSDNIITSLMSQSISPTTWYRLVAGLNAQLRLVRRGRLKVMFQPVLGWLETFANPALRIHGVRVDLAWFQATTFGYCQYGLLVSTVEEDIETTSFERGPEAERIDQYSRFNNIYKEISEDHPREETIFSHSESSSENILRKKRTYGGVIDTNSLGMIKEGRDLLYPFTFIIYNTKPVGHQDLVGLLISMLLLADFSFVLLTFVQLYSVSLADVFLVLFILPLGILLPFPAGINALFSHGPKRSAGLARVYALWNITSLANVVVVFICGYAHNTQMGRKSSSSQPWNFNMGESEWWIFPVGLVLCKCVQSRLINWHVANLEIQDRSLYSTNFELFWQS